MLSSSLIRKCSKCAEQVYTVAFYCGKTMVMESTFYKIAGCRAPNLERERETEREERESEREISLVLIIFYVRMICPFSS